MSLRFQKNDDVDRAVEDESAGWVLVFLLLLFAVIDAAIAWITGESLASYRKSLVFLIGIGFVLWRLAPLYYEFRIRTKEIDGRTSVIEETLKASREDHRELLERLRAVEEGIEHLMERVENLDCGGGSPHLGRGIKESSRIIDTKLDLSEPPK